MGSFQGIYGFDFLSIFILILSSVFNFWQATRLLGFLLFGIVVFRTLSKDIYKRKNEYEKFRSWANRFLDKIGLSIPNNLSTLNSASLSLLISRLKHDIDQRKKYKIIRCPGCRKKLKLPRGRGKVIITCKSCSTEFKIKI